MKTSEEINSKGQQSKDRRGGARECLLDAAARLFYQQGYHQTGINQIIEEAGVAKASFYNHFSSKQELGIAHVRRHHERGLRKLKERVGQKETLSKKIEAVFDHVAEYVHGEADYAGGEDFRGCGLINMAVEFPSKTHPIRERVREQKQEVRDYLLRLLREAHEENGSSRGDDSELESRADQVYLLYEAAMVESETFSNTWPVEAAKGTALSLVDTSG